MLSVFQWSLADIYLAVFLKRFVMECREDYYQERTVLSFLTQHFLSLYVEKLCLFAASIVQQRKKKFFYTMSMKNLLSYDYIFQNRKDPYLNGIEASSFVKNWSGVIWLRNNNCQRNGERHTDTFVSAQHVTHIESSVIISYARYSLWNNNSSKSE